MRKHRENNKPLSDWNFKSNSTWWNPYLAPQSGREPMGREVRGPRRETSFFLLKEVITKLIPNDLISYAQESDFSPFIWEASIFKIVINTEAYNLPIFKD